MLPPLEPSLIRRYDCRRASDAPVINGDLDTTFWRAAEWTADFVDIEGPARPLPRLRTRAKFLWDDECLYVGVEMEEPDVWATLTERDSVIFHDNDIEVFLNPSCDELNYYELELNAFNTVWDLLLRKKYRDGGEADSAWSIRGLRTAVHIDGPINDPSVPCRGWTAEIAIPFSSLDAHTRGASSPAVGDEWKFNLSRVQWDLHVVHGRYEKVPDRAEHNWVWSPMGLIDMHLPARWGILTFVK